MTFWYGSGPVPLTHGSGFGSDPAVPQQKTIFSAYYFLKVYLDHRIQGFPYYFCLMIEGSGSGSVPLTNGSGSEFKRPKNIRILRIRILNTSSVKPSYSEMNTVKFMLFCTWYRPWKIDKFCSVFLGLLDPDP